MGEQFQTKKLNESAAQKKALSTISIKLKINISMAVLNCQISIIYQRNHLFFPQRSVIGCSNTHARHMAFSCLKCAMVNE